MDRKTYEGVLETLRKAIEGTEFAFRTYSVGGCERDFMMCREIKDIDLVVELERGGIRLAEYLEQNGYTEGSIVKYENFGTVMFRLKDFPDIELEAVHTRKECYRDAKSRDPQTAFGTIDDDCHRRDFTYNAIYYNISTKTRHDFNGNSFADMASNEIRSCGEPDIIFKEDPLRILRMCKFVARYDSSVEKETYDGAKRNVSRLNIISKERIHDELIGILNGFYFYKGIDMLFNLGVMKYLISDLNLNPDLSYEIKRMFFYMHNDVPIDEKLAALFIWCSDPEKAMRDLKFSNSEINDVMFLIKAENMAVVMKRTDVGVRELQYACKTKERFEKVCRLYEYHSGFSNEKILALNEAEIENGTDMFDYVLPVNGDDIMEITGMGPCKLIKAISNRFLEDAFILGPKAADREYFIWKLKYYVETKALLDSLTK